jgi:hypothetical protein
MVLLVAKLVGTPCLIVLVSLVARRFGPQGAGLLAGLPLSSGPVAGLLVAAEGAPFGRTVALGILLGLVGAQAFIVAYAFASPRTGWPLSAIAGFAGFGAVGTLSYVLAPGPLLVVPVVLLGLVAIRLLLGPMDPGVRPGSRTDHGWPDLLLRAAIAATIVVALTSAAPLLGPRLSGILAPVPVATAILSVFTQRTSGPAAVRNLLRGVAGGAYSFWAFFTVLYLVLTHLPTLAAFGGATTVALAIQAVRLAVGRSRDAAPVVAVPRG